MYEVSTGVRSTKNEDGGIVLDISQGKIFHLNGIGALIFERISQRVDISQIVAEVSQAWGVSSEKVKADVVDFLDSLEKQELVERSETVAR